MSMKCRRFGPVTRWMALVWLCIGSAAWVRSQSANASAQPASQPPAGLESPWDVRQILTNLLKDNQELQPLLARINPQQWFDQKGASIVYVSQWQLAQRQLADVVTTSKLLAQDTENLPLALDDYFRLEALEVTCRSLEEGAQKYADQAVAGRLSELIAHNFTNRQRFRDYIRDLAASTEQNFKIADEEAQRCRGMISKEPPPVSKRGKKY